MAKILVVDDSPIDRRLLQGVLKREEGFDVEVAANGLEAIGRIPEVRPDVLVTDLQMPDMDGLELVTIVRDQFPALPVILVTAYGSEDLAVQALSRGAASYVPKSHLAEKLVESVRAVLALAGSQQGHQRLAEGMTKAEFAFCLANDPETFEHLIDLVLQIATSLNVIDSAEQVRFGMALGEALAAAMYRGNLELSDEQLNLVHLHQPEGMAVVRERLAAAPYRDRKLHVAVQLSAEEVRFVVRDESPGFNVARLPAWDRSPELDQAAHRGWVLMQAFVNDAFYNDAGTELTLVKRPAGKLLELEA